MTASFNCEYPSCGFVANHGEPTTGDCEELREGFVNNSEFIGALEINSCPMVALKSLVVKSVAEFEGVQNA